MNWIGLITNLLTAVNVLVCLLIILLTLLQRPKDQGLGAAFGGDTASNIFGAQTTNVLATLTRWLGTIFLVICLLIAVLGTHDTARQGKIKGYLDKLTMEQAERDKAKEAEKAAKDAEAKRAQDAAAKSGVPSSATSQPVQLPPASEKPGDKPATPSTPATDAPKPAPKPSEPKAPETTPEPKAPAPAPAPKPAEPKPPGGN